MSAAFTATIANYGAVSAVGANCGVNLAYGGTVTNGSTTNKTALIAGYGGVIARSGSATITNFGTIRGVGLYTYNADGVLLDAGGMVTNGSAADTAALIIGYNFGLVAQGAAVVTNFGTIASDMKASVAFHSASDRVMTEAGSKFFGAVLGGGGALELDGGGTGVFFGLGSSTATLFGGISGKFRGFGSYFIDAGSSWTLSGTNTVCAGQSLTVGGTLVNAGALNGGLTLWTSAARLIVESGSTITGTAVGGGGTLELASGTGTITGLGATATILGGAAATVNGFGACG